MRPSAITRLAAAVLVVLLGTWAVWVLGGGHLYFVASPSMGRVAPVGSLVVARAPTDREPLTPGKLIVFEPPDRGVTYVHRIADRVGIGRGAGFHTKGDLNAIADPWVAHRADLLGVPVSIVPALGWIYHWAGWLAFGGAAGLMVAAVLGPRWRSWSLSLGTTLAIGVPMLASRPLIGGVLYGASSRGRHVTAQLVSTGVFPTRFTPGGGRSVVAEPGQLVSVRGVPGRGEAIMGVRTSPAFPWWAWCIVVALCLVPMVVSWWVARDDGTVDGDDEPDRDPAA